MLRKFSLTVALVMAGLPALADDVQSSIIEQLRQQGFSKITVSRTLLGRGRIIAESPTLTREIIFHPTTGAILRDYWTEQEGGEPRFGIIDLGRRSRDDDSQDSSDDSGDEGDDSGDDSGDEGDNSGSGSGDDGDGDDGGDDGDGDDGGDSGEGDDGGDSGEGDDGGDD